MKMPCPSLLFWGLDFQAGYLGSEDDSEACLLQTLSTFSWCFCLKDLIIILAWLLKKSCDKIYVTSFKPLFQVYSSVALNPFILLWNHHHHSAPEHSYRPKPKFLLKNDSSFFFFPSFWQSLLHFSVSRNMIILGTSNKWNYIVFVHLCLAYFT